MRTDRVLHEGVRHDDEERGQLTAIATIQMHAKCMRRGSRFQPKIHNPMKVDSKKNAASPSIARGAPNTSPTNREYSLQFIPNWNSCTIPVATPIAKLIRKSFPKNFVSRHQATLRSRPTPSA